jgi:hypothetical protein
MAVIRLREKEAEAIRSRADERMAYNAEDRGCAGEMIALLSLDAETSFPIQIELTDAALSDLFEDGKEMRQVTEDNVRLAEGVAIDWRRSGGDAFYVWVVDQVRLRSMAVAHEVSLAKAELTALMHFAKTWIFGLSYACESSWVAEADGSVLEKQRSISKAVKERAAVNKADEAHHRKVEDDDLEGALEVFGVLQGALSAFSQKMDPGPADVVWIEFSGVALRWLKDKREEERQSQNERGIVTRNHTFLLFVLDRIASRLGFEPASSTPELKAEGV